MKIKIGKEELINKMLENPDTEYWIGIISEEQKAHIKATKRGMPVEYQGTEICVAYELSENQDPYGFIDMSPEEARAMYERQYVIYFNPYFTCPSKPKIYVDLNYDMDEHRYYTFDELWSELNHMNFIEAYTFPSKRKFT